MGTHPLFEVMDEIFFLNIISPQKCVLKYIAVHSVGEGRPWTLLPDVGLLCYWGATEQDLSLLEEWNILELNGTKCRINREYSSWRAPRIPEERIARYRELVLLNERIGREEEVN